MDIENTNTNENPFGIPEGYFEGFEASIEARLAEEELREIANSPGFAVPQGYFGSVEQKVMEKLDAPQTKVIPLFSRKTVYAAIAVAAAVVLAATIFNSPATSGDGISFENIDTQTLEEYINSDVIAYTDAELLDFVTEEELSSEFLLDEEISDESIENYLLENLDDIDLITTYEE